MFYENRIYFDTNSYLVLLEIKIKPLKRKVFDIYVANKCGT